MSSQLLRLPSDLLLRILDRLDIDDLHILEQTSAVLRDTIRNSLNLRYRLLAAAAGVQNNSHSDHSILERLQLLNSRRGGWHHNEFDFQKTIPFSTSFYTTYDLTGGIYFGGADGINEVNWCKLPSISSNVPVWKTVKVNKSLVDIGVNALEHDLIAILTCAPRPTDINHSIIEIFLLQLSTGHPHPLAQSPILSIDKTHALRPSVHIQIAGEHLVLVMSQDTNEGRPINTLCVYEWKSGNRKMYIQYPYRMYNHAVFLSPLIFLLPNHKDNTLDIWRIPVGDETCPTEPFLALELPGLRSSTLIETIGCRAEPNLCPSGTPYSKSPFHDKPENAIIFLAIFLHTWPWTVSSYHLYVHRNTLLEEVRTRRPKDRLGASYALPGTTGMIPGCWVRPWHDWGPDITRVFPFGQNYLEHYLVGRFTISGQRALITPKNMNHDGESLHSKILLDFNPTLVTSLARERARMTNHNTHEPHSLVTYATDMSIHGLADPVTSKLPYVSMDVPVDPAWDVLLDEERLIVLLYYDKMAMEILHVGIPQISESTSVSSTTP